MRVPREVQVFLIFILLVVANLVPDALTRLAVLDIVVLAALWVERP